MGLFGFMVKKDKTVTSAKKHADHLAKAAEAAKKLHRQITAVETQIQQCELNRRNTEGNSSRFWEKKGMQYGKKKLELEEKLQKLSH
jgi:hypothetical protein